MKMDSIRPTTPPPADKDEHHRNAQKTPNQHRPSKTNWNPNDRSLFFDAINEFGKDFESIANYINVKQKRKNATDPTFKAKEHVRLHYYQTFTKISKYLRFSEGEFLLRFIFYLHTSKSENLTTFQTWLRRCKSFMRLSITVKCGKRFRLIIKNFI